MSQATIFRVTKERWAQVGITTEFLIVVRTLGEFFRLRHVHGTNFSTAVAALHVGGALIAAPLSVMLMDHFKTPASNGVLETFVTMGVIYFMYMMIGVYAVRVPPPDWKPAGWSPPARPKTLVTTADVAVEMAWRTPQRLCAAKE